jgi:hypothetical protein
MSKLDQNIKEWRRQMSAGGISTREMLDELEAHLRDAVAEQIRSGLSLEQAFDLAVQQIGSAEALKAEFAKTVERAELRERKLKLFCTACMGLAYLTPLVLAAPKPWSRMTATEQWLGLSAVALTVLSMFSGLFIHRFLPIIPDKRIRTRVQFACAVPLFIWLGVFGYGLLPRLELTVGQVMVATLWAISPLALFGGVILGLDEAARTAQSSADF